MKQVIAVITVVLFFRPFVQSQDFQWVRGVNGNSPMSGKDVCVAGNGNIYVTGYFDGTADFGTGGGSFPITSAGFNDVFLAKYDGSGSLIWALGLGGSSSEEGTAVYASGTGNVYVAGFFSGTCDFDPGSGTFNLSPTGGSDVFLACYDAQGALVWARNIGGPGDDKCRDLSPGPNGNMLLTGSFSDSVDFDPGAGTAWITSAGYEDVFFSCFDPSGNYRWARRIGNSNSFGDEGYSVATDPNGNILLAGRFSGTADFDPGNGTALLSASGNYDAFVAKYDTGGNYLWSKKVGGNTLDRAYRVATDLSGNVYAGGYFEGTADFDPGPGVNTLTAAGGQDIFVLKLDASGNHLWAFPIGSSGSLSEDCFGLTADNASGIYVSGIFAGQADFDPGNSQQLLTPAGAWDIYLAHYSSGGNYLSAWSIGTSGAEVCWALAKDNASDVYLTGYYENVMDFDPSSGNASLSPFSAGSDGFLARYGPSGAGISETDPFPILVFPNPGNGLFRITSAGSGFVNFLSLQVFDLSGRLLLTNHNPFTSAELDLQSFIPGVYLIELTTGAGVFRQKLIKD